MSKLITPLVTAADKLPQPTDLTLFWQNAESVVEGLDLNVPLEQLGSAAIAKLAPVIIGQAGWAILTPTPNSWKEVKEAATARFGLTADRLEDAFFQLKPEANESTANFVCRVEGVRALRSYPRRGLLASFDKHFSPRFSASVRHIRQTVSVTLKRPLNWDDVVALAGEEKISEKAVPHPTPPKGDDGATPAIPLMHGQTPAVASRDSKPPTCSLCVRLGIGGHRHDRNRCYIDPKSPEYREHVRKRRLQECINQGKEVPKDILDMAPFTPGPR